MKLFIVFGIIIATSDWNILSDWNRYLFNQFSGEKDLNYSININGFAGCNNYPIFGNSLRNKVCFDGKKSPTIQVLVRFEPSQSSNDDQNLIFLKAGELIANAIQSKDDGFAIQSFCLSLCRGRTKK